MSVLLKNLAQRRNKAYSATAKWLRRKISLLFMQSIMCERSSSLVSSNIEKKTKTN